MRDLIRRPAFAAVAVLFAAFATIGPRVAHAEDVTVFAAASLKNALDDIVAEWAEETGKSARVSYAGSSALARQIQQGAPADLFISANPEWMDTLEADGLIVAGTRRDLLGNAIVLVAHGSAEPVALEPGVDLVGLLGDGRLAMALVDAVPAGIYGKAALTSLGVWDAVEPKVAQSDNVRTTLALVARGEAPYGIVYATDAVAEDDVTVVGTFPADTHPPIIYPAAIIADSTNPDAPLLLDFISSPTARPLFERQGFTVLD
ncbi:molybdate ABC transporter substrate-binding protein [Acuticoccus sp. M5D2P5]|uniref:molybdate ABC transporter substrate-binding protein n=1 Tax=Acuticoccus kalidii TaxID=2910977 RepID=UPI001F3FD0A6|nr:molybdate ABC transporter substrate-binding protein [Acuticoccus kalidii]MCF3936263.1 molybdate ABC transporter substrate-binding protein [Acuticoccus kalidii]